MKRNLKAIVKDLNAAFKRDAQNIICIGRLLIEAREQLVLKRGWVQWLRNNFDLSERTAYNYINAAKLDAKHKFATVANLRPAAIYEIAEMEPEKAAKVIEAAKQKKSEGWIDRDQVQLLLADDDASLEAQAEKLLDSTASQLPEAPPAILPRDAASFDALAEGVKLIVSLTTKSAEKLAASEVRLEDIEVAAALLSQIAAAKRRKMAA